MIMKIQDLKVADKKAISESVEQALANDLTPVTIYRRLEGYKGLTQTEYAMLTAGTLAACGFWNFTPAGAARKTPAPSTAYCELARMALDSTMVNYWDKQGLMNVDTVKTPSGKTRKLPRSLTPAGIAKLVQRFADYASKGGKGYTCSPAMAAMVRDAVRKGGTVRVKDSAKGDRELKMDLTASATTYEKKAPAKRASKKGGK